MNFNIENITVKILKRIDKDNNDFQKMSKFGNFGKIFPKLDFVSNLIYTYNRDKNCFYNK